MRIWLAVLSTVVMLLLAPAGARACGTWTLRDEESERAVKFYIHTAFATAKDAPEARILLVGGDRADAMYTERGGRHQLDFSGDTLRLYGKPIGRRDGDTLELGRRRYRIAVTRNPASKDIQDRWLVEVHRDERRIARGVAMAMCMASMRPPFDEPGGKGDQLDTLEIRNRVIFYLAWRDVLGAAPIRR